MIDVVDKEQNVAPSHHRKASAIVRQSVSATQIWFRVRSSTGTLHGDLVEN